VVGATFWCTCPFGPSSASMAAARSDRDVTFPIGKSSSRRYFVTPASMIRRPGRMIVQAISSQVARILHSHHIHVQRPAEYIVQERQHDAAQLSLQFETVFSIGFCSVHLKLRCFNILIPGWMSNWLKRPTLQRPEQELKHPPPDVTWQVFNAILLCQKNGVYKGSESCTIRRSDP
jgi:hypothetical protein